MTRGAAAMVEPLLDLERLVAGVRWRRRIWTSFALLGLFVGVLLTVLFPPPPTAATRLLVVHAEDQQTSERQVLMDTDVALCQTSEVAAAALKKIQVNERPTDFLATYQCVGVTPNVLEITVAGANGSDAVRRAQALDDVVIADHLRRTQEAFTAQSAALLDARGRLESNLAMVNNSISATTTPAQLNELTSVREGLAAQIQNLQQQAEKVSIGAPEVAAGTQVVDPPIALPAHLPRTGIINTAVGLVLGLGLGLAVATVLSVTGDRPVLRRDIAAELGVSIIAQLPSPPRGPRRLRRRAGHVRERRRVAATLARVVRDALPSISLLEIGCPGTAAALALDIAAQLTPEHPVTVVADLSRERLSEAAADSDSPARIVDVADLPLDQPSPVRGSELSLGVGSVGPEASWADLGRLGAATLLVVRAGYATTLGLHTIARQLAHSEISAIGVVLVAPDPRDRSDGTLWDALHAALRAGNALSVLEPSATSDEEVGIP